MAQSWHDLLFAHWPVAASAMRPLIPAALDLDLFDGSAWVAVVPFWMSGVRARGMPALPGVSRFPELNVRSYVRFRDKPGVFFFSLDAANLPAVWAARRLYHLPYFYARMKADETGQGVAYSSRRLRMPAEFCGRYRPIAAVDLRRTGSIEHWLTERYCLYTVHNVQVYAGEIHHEPWPLQNADAEIETNTMAEAAGIGLPDRAPLLHFARRLDVIIWPIRRLT
jgi:uncharacterized protein YqjF (DUF2071 family)